MIAEVSRVVDRPRSRRALSGAVLVVIALAVSACGSERDSSRVLQTIEAEYGVSVVSCNLDQPTADGRRAGQWRCDLSSPRTDTQSGVTSTSWCVTNASPDNQFETARLAYARPSTRHC
jgi:hypothetical protein